MARFFVAVAAMLIVVGLAVAVWYIGWGVHSCDDWGDNPRCEQMDRHADVFLASLAALAVGVGLALGSIAVSRGSPRDRRTGAPGG
jgi:hypothetical protein